jgi:hypothetical protein
VSAQAARGLASFFALAAFASLEYSTLLLHPPAARVLAVTAIATACAAAIALSPRVSSRPHVGTALRVLLVLAALLLGLLITGIPAHLLAPARWGALGGDARRGLHALSPGLWPFRGTSVWARAIVLAVLPVSVVLAAAASFWPSPRGVRVRPLVSLAILIALLVAGEVNQPGAAWRVQGLMLLGLLAAWLWLPVLEGRDVTRAACWLLACAVPALLLAPSLSAVGPWIGLRSEPAPVTDSFQWDQTYGPIPWSRSTATMFEIAEPQPALLKVTSLDSFDGVRFLRSGSPLGSAQLDLGPARAATAGYTHATVTIAGLRSNLLVSGGGEPVRVGWEGTAVPALTRSRDGTIALATAPASGARYTVLSYAPAAGATALRSAGRSVPHAYLPYTRFELPGAGSISSSPYAPMFALARRLAAGRRSSFDVTQAIERYLRRGYAYDERPALARYPLEAFLFAGRRGYCQQFSGAMALMLRIDGIPARVAAGFLPGVYDAASGAWQVRAVDAHSWVEVYFAGIGWVPFDPTPTRVQALTGTLGGAAAKAALTRASLSGGARGPTGVGARRSPAAGVRSQSGISPWWPAAALLAGLLLLGLCLWWLAGARRLRWALAGDAAGAVAELGRALACVGEAATPGVTIAQVEGRLQRARARDARVYLRGLREARFAAVVCSPPSARGRRELRRALGEGGGALVRLRLLLALPPGAARRPR